MKFIGFVFLFSFSVFANNMVSTSTRALLSYDSVKERSEEILESFKRNTLGEHADKVLILSPIVTGRVEFNALDMNFYFDHRNNNQAGVRYNLRF